MPAPPDAPSPLARLGALHAAARRSLAALSGPAPSPVQATAVVEAVDRLVDVLHRVEEDALFPALVEAMAGSDPVCVRELAAAATAGHRALEARWRQRRPACASLAQGGVAALDGDAVAALVEVAEGNARRDERELLPMAERLLDDAAIEQLGRRLDEREHEAGRARRLAARA